MSDVVDDTLEEIGKILLGKDHEVRLALACLLSRGHLLIEDLPGMGKTTLAQVLARVLNLSYNRIQFTSDLLPADILGISVYDRDEGSFVFHPGPVFSQLVLADEINRTTPKSQSALLEAMEERQVSVEGETRPLPDPFFVIATQNPSSQAGTFPLPESQLDRFLMRIALGYPDPASERELLRGEDRRAMLDHVKPTMDMRKLETLQGRCESRKSLRSTARLCAATGPAHAAVSGVCVRFVTPRHAGSRECCQKLGRYQPSDPRDSRGRPGSAPGSG